MSIIGSAFFYVFGRYLHCCDVVSALKTMKNDNANKSQSRRRTREGEREKMGGREREREIR